MDGITVLQDLRAVDDQTPVVILTGAGTELAETQARELGAAAFIEKEFSLHRLGETLRRLLSHAPLQRNANARNPSYFISVDPPRIVKQPGELSRRQRMRHKHQQQATE